MSSMIEVEYREAKENKKAGKIRVPSSSETSLSLFFLAFFLTCGYGYDGQKAKPKSQVGNGENLKQ